MYQELDEKVVQKSIRFAKKLLNEVNIALSEVDIMKIVSGILWDEIHEHYIEMGEEWHHFDSAAFDMELNRFMVDNSISDVDIAMEIGEKIAKLIKELDISFEDALVIAKVATVKNRGLIL